MGRSYIVVMSSTVRVQLKVTSSEVQGRREFPGGEVRPLLRGLCELNICLKSIAF